VKKWLYKVAGAYISYPFCTQKCTFCNFASGVSSSETRALYLAALMDEIRSHDWRWNPETLYFGGGTPSLIPLSDLQALLRMIPAASLCEATLECAPGTVTTEAAKAWASLGINRVSLGVQTFVTEELRRTGRRHTAEIVARDVEILKQAGIPNLNIDLIAGLPGQTLQSWEESLDSLERLRVPHVSVYIFEVDDDSRLGKESLLGGVRYGADILPSEDLTADLYERAVERLTSMGIVRYEISNFARPGAESRHNLKYWHLEPYVGFGLDAHSFDGTRRWSNPEQLADYLAGAHTDPAVETNRTEEHFFVGLRLSSGIEPTTEEWSRFAEPIARGTSAGMLEAQDGRLRLSDRGVLLSNEVLQEFVGECLTCE
jgi:oxygen-independent coproporphyrinogen III oxidase